MPEIVKKIAEAPAGHAAPTGQPGSLDRDIRFRVRARTTERQTKEAEVWAEANGQPAGSRWAIQCDEGTRIGGDDTAPPPLAYFSAALAFWLLTQISRSGEMMKLELKQVNVDQVIRFFRKGSILGGTIQSGSLGLEVSVDVESDEPKDKIARLVRVAEQSCFTHGAIANPVPVETNVRLNGQPLDVRSA